MVNMSEEHPFNISRDNLYSVFYHFTCTMYHHDDVITLPICIMQKRHYL